MPARSLPILATLLLLTPLVSARAEQQAAADAVRVEHDISYLPADAPERRDEYAAAQCKLDLYLPAKPPAGGCPLIVWFHGGGLTGGSKSSVGDVALAKRFVEKGIAVAQVEYRFSPKVKYPTYLQDAAKAVAWTVAEAPRRGVNPKAIFVGGHSAGGYISAMLALDEHLLKGAGVAPGAVAGFVPVSGQMMTHFTVRAERGLPKETILADEAAPIYHARKDAPPILLLAADHDMAGRPEEAKLLAVVLTEVAENKTTSVVVIPDRTHGSINDKLLTEGDPAGEAVLAFIRKWAPETSRFAP